MGTSRCNVFALLALALLGGGAAGASERYAVDWKKTHLETVEHYTRVLRMDTTNPPGNETKVANYVKGVLDREGIQAELLALEPARANVVARIRGNGSKKPILVMGHSDTVGV